MSEIYQLTEPIEGYTACRVNFVIDDIYVNADLGVIDIIDDERVFIPEYTSAVIEKSKIVNYVED